MIRTAIFVSARNKARRLPGKTLQELQGRRVLEHIFDRVRQARTADLVVLTTSTHADDQVLVDVAARSGVAAFQGSEEDKLARYLAAAAAHEVGFAVIVDGDDVLCDPQVIDRIIAEHRTAGGDFIVVDGLPVGVTGFGVAVPALRRVVAAKKDHATEIWGRYFTEDPSCVSKRLAPPAGWARPEWRMTLDYPEDLAFFERVFAELYRPGEVFPFDAVVDLLDRRPEIAALNAGVQAAYEENLRRTAAAQSAGAPASDSERSHRVIPGGAHTYSKGDDQFPSNAPGHLERGDGVHVWARNGTRFLDWTMGLRSVSLGYGVGPVNDAAIAQIHKGANFGRPSFLETEYAEELLDHLGGRAEMVKLAKNGSNVTTAAVKLARAYTGRDLVALCRDHAFFSFDDWFIGTTPVDAGVPEAVKAGSVTFPYGDAPALEALFQAHPGRIACVILEAATTTPPPEGYLQRVRALCDAHGAVFVLDEMITGFRWDARGAQAYYGVEADLATFGKGMANGFAVAALVGRRDILERGGLRSERPRVFLLSTTHGAENHAIAAARATLRLFRSEPVVETMWSVGQALIAGLNRAAREEGISEGRFSAQGVPCSPWYAFFHADGTPSAALRTLFLQEMVERGVLFNYIAPSWSHRPEHVERTLAAAAESFRVVRRAIEGRVEDHLKGPVIRPVFRKHN